jgi:hypothetical protein
MTDTVHISASRDDEDDEWYPVECEPGEHEGDEYANREADVPVAVWERWNAANAEWFAARAAVIDAAGFDVDLPPCDKAKFDTHVHPEFVRVMYRQSEADGAWPYSSDAVLWSAAGADMIANVLADFEAAPDRFGYHVGGRIVWIDKTRCYVERTAAQPWRSSLCDRCGHTNEEHPNFPAGTP